MSFVVTLLGLAMLIALVADAFRRRRSGITRDDAEALAEADRELDAIEREARDRRDGELE